MKKTDKTALTAAAFAAALNVVPMASSAYDPAEEPIQDVYGPPAYYETTIPEEEPFDPELATATTFEPVYGPPEVMYSMYPWLTSTTTETTAVTETTSTTSEILPQPEYGPPIIPGDLTDDGVVDTFDLIAMRKIYVKSNGSVNYTMSADTNNDNKFTLADLVVLNKFLLGKIKGIGPNYDPQDAMIEDPVTTVRTEYAAVYGPPSWFERNTTTTVAPEDPVTETTIVYTTVYGPPSVFEKGDE